MYHNNLTLADIFNESTIKKKLPTGNYKEGLSKQLSNNAQLRIIANQVADFTRQAASPYYKPLSVTRNNRTITVKGKLTKTYNAAYNGIVKSLEGKKRLLATLASNNEVLRTAIIEDSKRETPYNIIGQKKDQDMPKELYRQYASQHMPGLYLRTNSLADIKNMNANQLFGVVNDIIDNITYSGNYPQTAKAMGIDARDANFNIEKRKWMKKVGIL